MQKKIESKISPADSESNLRPILFVIYVPLKTSIYPKQAHEVCYFEDFMIEK